jgi:hypothetical protein
MFGLVSETEDPSHTAHKEALPFLLSLDYGYFIVDREGKMPFAGISLERNPRHFVLVPDHLFILSDETFARNGRICWLVYWHDR